MLHIVSKAVRLVGSRPGRAILFLRMAFWVTTLSLAVRLFSLPRALSIVAPSRAVKPVAGADGDQELATAIDALLGLRIWFFSPICWKRAVILHRYLTLRGRVTTINFGLRKEPGGKLDGHAWLEASGKPILESRTPEYTVTYVFPSTAPCDIELASMAKSSSTQESRPTDVTG
jgi:hypothetical protein